MGGDSYRYVNDKPVVGVITVTTWAKGDDEIRVDFENWDRVRTEHAEMLTLLRALARNEGERYCKMCNGCRDEHRAGCGLAAILSRIDGAP